MSKPLAEMDPNEFLGMVDTLMENLERQAGEDPVGGRAVSEVKNEIRRRILSPQDSVAENPLSVPIKVEIERRDLDEVVRSENFGDHFHGTPCVVTLVGPAENGLQTLTNAFFSVTEADGFLSGLRAARSFGLPFEEIPDMEDIPEREIYGGGAD